MVNFGYFLLRNADCFPDRIAVVCEDRELTYSELNAESNRLANALKLRGLKRGDRLALLMKSSVDWLVVWYACQKIGVAVVPLHVRLMVDELIRTVETAECTCMVFGSEFSKQASGIKANCLGLRTVICRRAVGDAESYDADCFLDELVLSCDIQDEAQENLGPDDESVILFTSGTTGVSKGVLRSQQMVRDHALILAAGSEPSEESPAILTPAPLYHTAGLFCIFKSAALAATLILISSFEPEKICHQIEARKATEILLLPPISYQRLYQSEAAHRYDLSSVKLALVTAGKCTEKCIEEIFEMFPNSKLRPSWGSTEVCSATGCNLSRGQIKERPELAGTVGKLNTLVDIKIVDESGARVPAGMPGEALVRSPMVFNGYLGREDERDKVFVGDWFRTEDIMRVDEDGYYYLVDRKRDIVKTGGENVYAQEVERALQAHPAIMDSAVIGVPDPRFGEAIAAAIVLNPGEKLTSAELLDFCAENLASYKKPRYWALMESLPENSVGKVQKNILRENAAKIFTRIA